MPQFILGERHTFRLLAVNFNGNSSTSDEYTFNACIGPTSLPAPFRISGTVNAIKIGWTAPLSNGGCPITSYAVYRDDSIGGDVTTEVNSDTDASVRSNAVLREVTVTNWPTATSGSIFRFKVRVFNRESYVDSPYS